MALANTLEYALIRALISKEIGPESVERKTLTHLGQKIHQAVEMIRADTGTWDEASVVLMVTDVFGVDKSKVQEYFGAVKKTQLPGAVTIHSLLRDRSAMLGLSNEIQRQMNDGNLDLTKLQSFLTSRVIHSELSTAADDLANGVPTPPTGPELKSLPMLSEVTNGVYGMYIIAGMPGVGKSTLGGQVQVDINRNQKVLVYDHENGRNVLLYRLVQNFGVEKARAMCKNIYIRDSLRTLTRDLEVVKSPATILVDSIQKITTRTDERRSGLDDWIHRFEALKRDGYNVVLISEINRANYTGDPRMDCFKETGALEYAADSAIVLQEAEAGLLKVHVIKNRHYKFKGPLGMLERHPEHEYWFKEVDNAWGWNEESNLDGS